MLARSRLSDTLEVLLAALMLLPSRPGPALAAMWWQLTGRRKRARSRLNAGTRQGGGPLYGWYDRKTGLAGRFRRLAGKPPRTPLRDLAWFCRDARMVEVFYWEAGNFFFRDIAAYTVFVLERQGIAARLCHGEAGDPGEADALGGNTAIIVAPHEFCAYGPGRHWPRERLAAAICLNTEQWQTSWFRLALDAMRVSRKVLDINPASAAALTHLGLESAFLPMLPLPGSNFDIPRQPLSAQQARLRALAPMTWPDEVARRPYDIAFVAVLNPRREAALARLAPTLARYDCFLHAPVLDGPLRDGSPDLLDSADFAQVSRHSRVLLNIHQGESAYFEWHRIVLSGIMEGCVVLTEPCTPIAEVSAGVHYLEAELDAMPALLDWLLGTPAGLAQLEAIHANCRALRQRVDSDGWLLAIQT